jgi:hypothetical protein
LILKVRWNPLPDFEGQVEPTSFSFRCSARECQKKSKELKGKNKETILKISIVINSHSASRLHMKLTCENFIFHIPCTFLVIKQTKWHQQIRALKQSEELLKVYTKMRMKFYCSEDMTKQIGSTLIGYKQAEETYYIYQNCD